MEKQAIKTILILREKFDHMGSHSGYDLLFDIAGMGGNIRVKSFYLSEKKRPFLVKVLQKTGWRKDMNDYGFNQYLLGLKTSLYTLFNRPSIIHLSFLEDSLFLDEWKATVKRMKRKARIIGTTHQPMNYWKGKEDTGFLNKLDALVVLNDNMLPFFRTSFPGVKLYQVPHAVDTGFFGGAAVSKASSNRCIFIGFWLRDFDCLFNTIHCAAERGTDIHFDLVIPPHGVRRLQEQLNQLPKGYFTLHSGITDEALRSMLSNGLCLFLPLKDYTANNSLLEALSCGLPVVMATTIQESSYYDEGAMRIFQPGETGKILDFLAALKRSNEMRLAMGKQARRFAEEQFSLPVVRKKMLSVYNDWL